MEKTLLKYTFFRKSKNTRQEAVELIKTTDKPIFYRCGFAFRGAPKREVTREYALEMCKQSLLDVDEYENEVVVNTFTENDMW